MSSRRRALALCAVGLGAVVVAGLALLPGQVPESAVPDAVSANGFTLANAAMILPVDDVALPDGPNVDLVRANCTACHSAAMLTGQPRLTAKQWQAIVEKMRTVYRAPVADGDVPGIVAYLTGLRQSNPPPFTGEVARSAGGGL